MCAAIDGIDIIREGIDLLVVGIVILNATRWKRIAVLSNRSACRASVVLFLFRC